MNKKLVALTLVSIISLSSIVTLPVYAYSYEENVSIVKSIFGKGDEGKISAADRVVMVDLMEFIVNSKNSSLMDALSDSLSILNKNNKNDKKSGYNLVELLANTVAEDYNDEKLSNVKTALKEGNFEEYLNNIDFNNKNINSIIEKSKISKDNMKDNHESLLKITKILRKSKVFHTELFTYDYRTGLLSFNKDRAFYLAEENNISLNDSRKNEIVRIGESSATKFNNSTDRKIKTEYLKFAIKYGLVKEINKTQVRQNFINQNSKSISYILKFR